MNKPVVTALYLNAALLGVIAVALLARSEGFAVLPAAYGQQQPQPIAGGAGLFLMPGQLSNSSWGCYVMDVDRRVLMVYSMAGGKLRLSATRDFSNDRFLSDFAGEAPSPAEVKVMVDKARDASRINPAPGDQ